MTPHLALVAAVLASGCVARDTVARGDGPDDRDAFCAGTGPPILLDDTCTGDLAAIAFRHAVCACAELSLATTMTLDGFDSRLGAWTPGGVGGDLASNRGLDTGGPLTVGGSVTVAGTGGLALGPSASIAGDLDVAAQLGRSSSAVTVGGSARIGAIDVARLDVAGTLTTPAGAAISGVITATTRATAAIDVPAPCPCGPDDAIDVAAVIAQHAVANHDAAIGLTADQFAAAQGDAALTLPCGRYFLDRIQISGGGFALTVTGRVALFIADGITLDGDLAITIAPGAELDVFVAGAINLPTAVTLGDPTRPRALRLYVASAGTIAIAGGSTVAGNLYAPAADLATSAGVEIFGAVLVNHWNLSAPAQVHYDRAIAAAGDTCEP